MTHNTTYLEAKTRIIKLDQERLHVDSIQGRVEPNIDNIQLGESRKFNLVILHIDITNFKQLVNDLSNEKKLRFLNIFLSEMTHIVHDHSGTVEKYVGDRVTAMFGIGMEHPVAVLNAINCARSMMYEIKKIINPYLKSLDLPEFQCTIGMDLGEVWISKVGIKNDSQFTLVGNAVNVASELEEIASPTQILLGSAVFQFLPQNYQLHCTLIPLHASWIWTITDTTIRYPAYRYDVNFEYPLSTTKKDLEEKIAELEFKLNKLSKQLN